MCTGVKAVAVEAVEDHLSDEEILENTPGLGAVLDGHGGVIFRVWAPHADAASLSIYDSEDSPGKLIPMQKEGLNWSTRVRGAKAGDKYSFSFEYSGELHERRDARARQTDYDSNICYVVDPTYDWSEFKGPSWDKLIIYQVHVGAFTGNEENGGTFEAFERKLDYIKGLGFTAIEFLPVHEYCGSWGYNPRLLFAIHPFFGSPQDLKRLVDMAHKKGLAVIYDVVLNHGAAKMNSLWAYDGWNKDGGGGLYFEGGTDTPFGKAFSWWQSEVQEMVLDAARMFLSEYNGDGLRFDCVHVMPWKVLKKLTKQLREEFPGKILISETTPESPAVIQDAGFDATWMHSSYYDMRAFMQGRRSLRKLESLLGLHPGYNSPLQCVKYFLGSHDQTGCRKKGAFDPEIQGYHRFAVELFGGRDVWEARAQARMWYSAMIVAAGIPMSFMGSEFHHSGWWGVNPDHRIKWELAEDEIGSQMRSLVKAANELRGENPALRYGGFQTVHFDETNSVFGFLRKAEGSQLLVVMNAGGNQWERRDYGVRTGAVFQHGGAVEVFNSQAAEFGGWEGSGNGGVVLAERDEKIFISVPKWSVLVFRS